jgi:tetratricopeptide (TPR) repeat protein
MDLILSAHDLDVERTSIAHGESLLNVAEHVALGRPAPLPDPTSHFCIEHQHVMLIERTTNIFRRWDNEFGGGLRRKAIIGQLNEASNMLGGPFRDEKVGHRFYSAVADLSQLAGWMSYDLELHATAQRYFLLGMHLARDGGDRPQVARMLYCLARQMIDLGRYKEALDLAQTGTYAIRRSATPKAAAMLLIIQARAYAGMGRAPECNHALGMAQGAFNQAVPGTDPEWLAFFGEGELYGSLGVALRDLALASEGDAERYAADARPWIERAIESRPDHFLRSRVMDMDSLAVVKILLKEPESAIEAASTAISMADRVASSRVIRRLRRTGQLAQTQFPRLSAIADLADQTRAIAVRSTDQRS